MDFLNIKFYLLAIISHGSIYTFLLFPHRSLQGSLVTANHRQPHTTLMRIPRGGWDSALIYHQSRHNNKTDMNTRFTTKIIHNIIPAPPYITHHGSHK